MVESNRGIVGRELLKYSDHPERLRRFLEQRPDRIGTGPSSLHKSIIVLRGHLGSSLHVVGSDKKPLPMLERTGKFPPSMLVPELRHAVTTDPDEQRIGCDYINLEVAGKHFTKCVVKLLINVACFIRDTTNLTTKIEEVIHEGFTHCNIHEQFPQFVANVIKFARGYITDDRKIIDYFSAYDWDEDWFQGLAILFLYRVDALDITHFVKKKKLQEAWDREARKTCDYFYRLSELTSEETAKRSLIMLLEFAKSEIHLFQHTKQIEGQIWKEAKNIVVQGAGNVSMNHWHVAYTNKKNRMIYTQGEKLNERQYSCLVSWTRDAMRQKEKLIKHCIDGKQLVCADSLSIGRLRFSPFDTGSNMVRLVVEGESIAIKDDIQYALYGQLLAWNGETVDASKIISEFSDLRHIFNLVNLNPDRQITSEEIEVTKKEAYQANADLMRFFSNKLEVAYASKPRYLFGVSSTDDVWLGESAFLAKPELLQSACDHPISISLADLGAPLDWITVCMKAWGYSLRKNRDIVSKPGDFAWDILNPTDPKLVWCPSPAYYPCTMVGIGSLGSSRSKHENEAFYPSVSAGDLFMLAWGHGFGEDQQYNIFECAQMLCDLGAKAVLLIDEGRDVFQHYFPAAKDLKLYLHGMQNDDTWSPVPPNREQIRGTLAFWTEEG